MFKIRASGASHIVSGTIGLTYNQGIDLATLENKEKALTPKQDITLKVLLAKKNNPELPDGVKTYCKGWKKSKVYKRKAEFSSKYTQKGNIVEDNSIDFVSDYLDLGMIFKNEDFFEDEFMTGTPDVILKDYIIDVKNSWSWETFPLFETEIPNDDYYWQAQVYMHLVGRDSYKLIYTLMDTPLHLIEKEAYYWCVNNGYEELDMDIYNKFVAKMTYSDVEDKNRIKIFDIKYNKKDIELLQERVKLCRKYIETLK